MKKLIRAAAVALACSSLSAAYAAATISFDRDGAGGVGAIAVNNFDWNPGNALAIGVFSNPVNPDGSRTFELVAQGKLGTFVGPGGANTLPVGASEFTFQVRFFEVAFGIGGVTTAFAADTTKPSSFKVFYDAVGNSDPITGGGYGDGLEILTGTIVSSIGSFTDNTSLFAALGPLNPFPITLLDQLNADDQNGVLTRQGGGSTTIQIDASFAHSDFFKSAITSLIVDLQDTTFNSVPFAQTDPSDEIVGETPSYSVTAGGDLVNGGDPAASCALGGQTENGAASARCDLHLQTDATTSFNPTAVPEPGSLALIGLALAGLGLGRRRKAAR